MLKNQEFKVDETAPETTEEKEEVRGVNLTAEEREKLETENYNFSQKLAREEFQKIGLNKEAALEWFDKKYGNFQKENISLRDQAGQLIGEKKFSEIDETEKIKHSLGLLKLIENNYNSKFIEHFFNEPELLDLLDRQQAPGHYLKKLVDLYQANQKKLGER